MQAPQKPTGLYWAGSLCEHERTRIQEDKPGQAEALPAMVVWHGRATFKVFTCLLSANPSAPHRGPPALVCSKGKVTQS